MVSVIACVCVCVCQSVRYHLPMQNERANHYFIIWCKIKSSFCATPRFAVSLSPYLVHSSSSFVLMCVSETFVVITHVPLALNDDECVLLSDLLHPLFISISISTMSNNHFFETKRFSLLLEYVYLWTQFENRKTNAIEICILSGVSASI